ncbi:MAG: low molecular weight phosphotyrosine protein phosphatase [Gammaproteobacteria bacterium]|uniref:low molecular weight protein-tyrosine-phosphatase n=1 Tax=Rhodoferax sp. TaxID=50421 RepID=UPI00181481C8|nr:low molecular weight protein-tyrosine-phosphatase [Rhodoferax sp.]MBU3897474.1 low molecular weight phosphotyrosine protein phosphatase [Gammaproteobacteria bacterium]MBA3058905.1 low molecular weight phosphotyrosine protein phosphatase [Rhodoferax sp.]MBU3996214.1 low molecular weight phosphotyrosine protein phosphatase [Gammaproteobacteria bacterium]MBU4018820.1 low molecular weight phosphotyrosine protein phosphatase [Gammaproteobacteria bacterium]MBU4079775.1 low molecular weight phosph
MTKLLMVCMGNTCRSPMARAIACKLAAAAALAPAFEVDSAGTHADPLGERPDPRAVLTLARHGYDMGRARSRRIVEQDFQAFDLILAMDHPNLAELRRLCPAQYAYKLHLFLEFAQDIEELEVPDPYYGNQEGFEQVLVLCEAGISSLIQHLLWQHEHPFS